MSGQPYSDKAAEAAKNATGWPPVPDAEGVVERWRDERVRAELDAAHDREALGLDASVCARTFLNAIVNWLWASAPGLAAWQREEIADAVEHEFGDQP